MFLSSTDHFRIRTLFDLAQVLDQGRLKLMRLIVRDNAMNTVGHGGSILVSVGGVLDVVRSQFRTCIARSQGGAIAVEGEATITDSTFIANIAIGVSSLVLLLDSCAWQALARHDTIYGPRCECALQNGGALHVGFNAPGQPPQPPTLTLKNCDFVDNVSKGGHGHAVHFGKSSRNQGQDYDNQKQLTMTTK